MKRITVLAVIGLMLFAVGNLKAAHETVYKYSGDYVDMSTARSLNYAKAVTTYTVVSVANLDYGLQRIIQNTSTSDVLYISYENPTTAALNKTEGIIIFPKQCLIEDRFLGTVYMTSRDGDLDVRVSEISW
jgi:hypothetical protein